MKRIVSLKRIVLILFLLVPSEQAFSAASSWAVKDQVSVRLLSAVDVVGDNKSVPMGLHFKLKPGWKIYWRSPGDAGLPPRISWKNSKNVASARIEWPAPLRFSVLGLETLGYKKEVVLPLKVVLREKGASVLTLKLDYLVCEEVCIPYSSKLSLALPGGTEKPSSAANLLARYQATVPVRDARHGISLNGAMFQKVEKGIQVMLVADAKAPFVAPDVFMEGPEGSYFGRPEVILSEDKKRAWLTLKAGGVNPSGFEKQGLVATLVDENRSIEASVPVDFESTAPAPPNAVSGSDRSLLVILLLAALGGLILNVMPCVLPVLSIKLLGVIGESGKDRATIRAGFLASAAGILFSFLLLAGFLIVLKLGGTTIGWGIQFQQPVFLSFLAVILALFAYNLFGIFEIAMPAWAGNLIAGSGPEQNIASHFMTGALATLVATPCSAPFLGTAVGFALSRGWLDTIAVFSVLGVGLAIPYLAVAAFPVLAQKLPRPGRWMNWVRMAMGGTLALTVLWLLYVMGNVIGQEGAVVLSAFLLLMGAVLWLRRVPASKLGRHASKALIVLSVAAIIFPVTWERSPVQTRDQAFNSVWQNFDRADIRKLVAEGKTVLVDVTADWCVTCQLNKRLVLHVGDVGEKIKSRKIIAMRADWTRPSDKIPAYLARFGRYGIPFNAVYGPQAPNGIVLPELLTSGLVLGAFEEASAKTVVSK